MREGTSSRNKKFCSQIVKLCKICEISTTLNEDVGMEIPTHSPCCQIDYCLVGERT